MARTVTETIRGSRTAAVVQEFFTNSAHFPLANLFLELLLEGRAILARPDLYVLLGAAAAQAWFLGTWEQRGRVRYLAGNLIGPAIYTSVEILLEGPMEFFEAPNHLAYWAFALAVGLWGELGRRLPGAAGEACVILENVSRTAILLAMYWIFEALSEPRFASWDAFMADDSHVFFALVTLFLGLIIGFARVAQMRSLGVLRVLARRLHRYSEWLLGRRLLERAVDDPGALDLRRRERAVLFMDIRGFTAWSERQQPERVLEMLNQYFEAAEEAWTRCEAIKAKLTGDEVMAVFATAAQARDAAVLMTARCGPVLARHDLSAGTGLHWGPLMEGAMGGRDVKAYDVIGDTVNTAKRLCDQAKGNEILVSAQLLAALGEDARPDASRRVRVKGKEQALEVYPLSAA